jgi:hypothetical protein
MERTGLSLEGETQREEVFIVVRRRQEKGE